MLRIWVGVAFSLLLVNAARSEERASRPPVESRKHATVNDAHGNVLYVVTSITTVSELGDAGHLLVLDKLTDQRYVMTSSYDIAGHRSSTSASDISGKQYVRISYPLPFLVKPGSTCGELEANATARSGQSDHDGRNVRVLADVARHRDFADLFRCALAFGSP